MARIRTIKPEFPQSESMGRVSRDARLLFIQLWTLCDDSGRTRAASRMLASLLYPYDDDAPSLLEDWIAELEREGCVVRYWNDGGTYLQVCNWLNHQKIDKPSKSKIPEFAESSRILSNPREPSSGDQGPKDLRIKDQGMDQLSDAGASNARKNGKRARPVPLDSDHPGFDEFYNAYPRHEKRADAAKAWNQVKPDLPVLLIDIRTRLERGHWTDPQFIPHPATYLRGAGWTDDITPRGAAAHKSRQAVESDARRAHNADVLAVTAWK